MTPEVGASESARARAKRAPVLVLPRTIPLARAAAALAASHDTDCAAIDARADLSDFAKSSIKQEIRTGKLRAADVASPTP